MVRCPTFHGILSTIEAELKLKADFSDKCYLVRYDTELDEYFLSVKIKKDGCCLHFVIEIMRNEESTQYEFKGTTKKFDTISHLLRFYEENPVNLKVYSWYFE